MGQKKYWYCLIGPVDEEDIPDREDLPLRLAVKNQLGQDLDFNPDRCSSGWISSGTAEYMSEAKEKHQTQERINQRGN